jgi:pimeloyl-ACP methyl ester carboxylesterase
MADMTEGAFAQRRAGEGRGLPYWEAGAGEMVVAIVDGERPLTRAYALLAERRRLLVFAIPADAGAPLQAAQRIGAALAALGVERFDLMGEGEGAAAALQLCLARQGDVGAVVLAAPKGQPEDGLREVERPVLVLCGTRDGSDAGDRYRRLLRDCHLMFVYDAGADIGAERPEALAYIAGEFFERRDLFLVSRESGMILS